MNKEQLMEAIGYVDEQLLTESEGPRRRHRITAGHAALIAAVIGALAITAGATAGLLSLPITNPKIVDKETVAPFSMDADGNIVPGGVNGLKVTMDVAFDTDAPTWIEELYRLDPGSDWRSAGGGSAGNGYEFGSIRTDWKTEGRPGKLRLVQSVASYYTQDGERCVGVLRELKADQVTSQITELAGLQVLKVTIPPLENYEGNEYCAEGEVRLYWTDGRYILELDYPGWVTDEEVQHILSRLHTQSYTPAYPANYGQIDWETVERMKPGFSAVAGSTGTTAANSSMGLGLFAYSDGSIYMGASGKLLRYDLLSGQTNTYVLENSYSDPQLLFCTDAYVCYVDSWNKLVAVNKETGAEQVLYDGIDSGELYADGMTLYTRGGQIDLLTGQLRQYSEQINSGYVDARYVYGTPADGGCYFLRREKDSPEFERIELDFHPIKVLADGEDLYFVEGGESKSYQLIRYRDGVQTRLPVYTLQYQLLDGQILYMDREGEVLSCYDPDTGETRTVGTNVFDFSVLENRYICMTLYNEPAVILDWETAQTVTME